MTTNTIITPITIDGLAMADLSQYPTEFGDSWIHVCFLNGDNLKILICLYKNNKYPNGTFVFSEYTPNDYPDMYTTIDLLYHSNRMYTNPIYRNRGYWKLLASLLRSVFYTHAQIVLEGTPNRSPIAHGIYKKVTKLVKHATPNTPFPGGRTFMPEQVPPRDPAFPVVWYGQRIGGFNG
jgi:hypothetical protein